MIVDAAAINIDNDFWKRSTKYEPSRHLGLKTSQSRYNLWRFGFGPRQCLGQHVAERILRALLVELVSKYELYIDEASIAGDALQDESWVGLPSVKVTCRAL